MWSNFQFQNQITFLLCRKTNQFIIHWGHINSRKFGVDSEFKWTHSNEFIIQKKECDGVIAVVSDPTELPNKGQFITSGTKTSIVIKPTLSYWTSDVNEVKPEQR